MCVSVCQRLIDFGDRNISAYTNEIHCADLYIYRRLARADEMAKQRKKKLKRSQDDDSLSERARAREQCHRFDYDRRDFIDECASCVYTHVLRWLEIAVRKLDLNSSQQRLVGLLAQFYRVRTGHFVPYPYRVIIPIADEYYVFFCCGAESFYSRETTTPSISLSAHLPDRNRLIFFHLLCACTVHTSCIYFHLLKCRSILQADRAVNIFYTNVYQIG